MSLYLSFKNSCEMSYMTCYDEILSKYETLEGENASTWSAKYLISLMNELSKNKGNKEQIRNCLILLINLFLNDSADHYNSRGKSSIELNAMEREILKTLLSECI